MDFQALVGRLELEAQNLQETIAVSQHRLQEIETFLKLGRKFTGQHEANTTPTTLAELMNVAPAAATQRDRVVDAAAKLLADGRRRPTRELLAEMNRFGVLPGGIDPASTLSTYLSRDGRFSNDNRRGGWTLAAMAGNEERQEIGLTLAGLARYGGVTEDGLQKALSPLANALMHATGTKNKES
jgi:hypothetical protein